MIELLLERLSKTKSLDQIIVATSERRENDALSDLVQNAGYQVFRGSEEDVLDRYYRCACQARADVVVRITADCPLIDADIVDRVVREFNRTGVDYASNVNPPTYPDGLDTEVFTFEILEKAHSRATTVFEREHVTPFIKNCAEVASMNISHDVDLSLGRWTVDEPEDFELIRSIFEYFSPDVTFSWKKVLTLANTNAELFKINCSIRRNEGSSMNTGQKLWKRAKRVIPGGSMLLSKRPEMFLPEQWPTYFSKSKGCEVWDLDGNIFKDFSLMGVGTNVLGYGHPEVDEAVTAIVRSGNMSTLNGPEEVYLAEKLVELHPWAHMVRFARTGGEANAIAIRLGRAAAGRDKVVICGYHGWHDWYLAANLSTEHLKDHLLPGLDPIGVPRSLRGSIFTFRYNQIDELETLIEKHSDIGVIKMEVARHQEPNQGFLERVRELASDKNIVLVFDECSSGFRQELGGLHKRYGVEPDVAVFGKTLGNGYAITAVVGRKEIMEHAQNTFISSTFWTERIGPAAALATIRVMEKVTSWDYVSNVGLEIRAAWQGLADTHGLEITQWGIPGLQGFSFQHPDANALKTFLTQEMLRKGFLANTTLYASTAHSSGDIQQYIEALDETFSSLKRAIGSEAHTIPLDGPECHTGFARLT